MPYRHPPGGAPLGRRHGPHRARARTAPSSAATTRKRVRAVSRPERAPVLVNEIVGQSTSSSPPVQRTNGASPSLTSPSSGRCIDFCNHRDNVLASAQARRRSCMRGLDVLRRETVVQSGQCARRPSSAVQGRSARPISDRLSCHCAVLPTPLVRQSAPRSRQRFDVERAVRP